MTPLHYTSLAPGVVHPGSTEAQREGCTCPTTENHFGRGYDTVGAATWLIRSDCPVHRYERQQTAPAPIAEVAGADLPAPATSGRRPRSTARPVPAEGRKRKSPVYTGPRVYKPKACGCGATFTPTGPRSERCPKCRGAA